MLGAAGDVPVGQPLQRQPAQGVRRVDAPVARVRVHVRHVQQQPRAGALQQLGEVLAFGELVFRPVEEGGDGFQGERAVQFGLHRADVPDHHTQRLPGPGHRQQVPGVQPTRADEGDVFAGQRGVQRGGRRGEPGHAVRMQGLGTAQGQPRAVRCDGDAAVAQPGQ